MRLLTTFVLLMTCCVSLAQQHPLTLDGGPFHARWELPDSPLGHRAGALLEVLSRSDSTLTLAFVEQALDEGFQEMGDPPEHLAHIHGMAERLGAFELVGIRITNTYRAELILDTENGELKLSTEVQDAPPHGIAGMMLQPYRPEDELGEIPAMADIETVDSYLTELEEAGKFSGVVLIARDDSVVFERAYGMADKETGLPNTLDTRFNLGSITKGFTAVSILQLIEAGNLSLDDRLSQFLPQFPPETSDRITVRHLLEMTSGYGDYFANPMYRENRDELDSVSDYLAFIRHLELQSEPGAQQRYSNAGYIILGGIVEAVTGSPYEDYVASHIFEPAGMTNSVFDVETAQPTALGYTNEGPTGTGFVDRNDFVEESNGTPAGGSYSSIRDVLRFDQALRDSVLLSRKMTVFFLNHFDESATVLPQSSASAGGSSGVSTVKCSDYANGLNLIVLSNYDEPIGEEIGLGIFRGLRDAWFGQPGDK